MDNGTLVIIVSIYGFKLDNYYREYVTTRDMPLKEYIKQSSTEKGGLVNETAV